MCLCLPRKSAYYLSDTILIIFPEALEWQQSLTRFLDAEHNEILKL
jgi:hypothetical protein